MTKLFLASYVFTTGDKEYKETRLVLVRSLDLKKDSKENFPWLNAGYEKFNAWFPKNYPESKLSHVRIEPPIDEEETLESSLVAGHFEQVKWEIVKEENAPDSFHFFCGPQDVGTSGRGATKAEAALDFLENFMTRPDYGVIRLPE